MGRTKYSDSERKTIIASFIKAAQDLIESDGIEGASIRKVSAEAGYSSATIYIYFKDISELVLLACVDDLEDYARQIGVLMASDLTARETYFKSWETFCHYAFAKPTVFSHLFFSEHTSRLDELVETYYSIYPGADEAARGAGCSLFLRGNLHERDMRVLRPFAREIGMSDEDMAIVDELSVCLMSDMLRRACSGIATGEELTADFMKAIGFLLSRHE